MKKFVLLIFISFSINLYSQELVIPANYSDNFQKSHLKTTSTADTLTLPFWVDFSKDYQMNYFTDSYVTLAQSQSVLPPSLGAAMFDATDSEGNYYTNSYNENRVGDYLTSRPIDLAFSAAQNVYFSFKYQPQGYLDAPNADDSLVLQFYSPSNDSWTTVWYATNFTVAIYKTVIFKISDAKYLQKGFRFRFYNRYTSAPSTVPSFVANSDFWFVDYIYLNKNRSLTDTSYADIAFQMPMNFKFDDYQNVPYSHYKTVATTINHSLSLNFRNNDNVIRQIDSMNIIFDEVHGLDFQKLFLGSYALVANNNSTIKTQNINFSFPTNISSDTVEYSVQTIIKTNTSDSTCNNIILQNKKLTDFYAYDDGTAENAYGLYGEGTMYAYVAQQFTTYKPDKLLGVQVYFNKTYNEQLPAFFDVMVWNNNTSTSTPKNIIYEPNEAFIIDFNKLNRFQTFVFDTPVDVTDTFYIGWKKISELLENVGLDINSTSTNYKYFMTNNGIWSKSNASGVLMMRPIFGYVLANNQNLNSKIDIFPNPASYIINVPTQEPNMRIDIYNVSGKLVFSIESEEYKTRIDVSNLQNGLYILKVYGHKTIQTGKFIKN